MTATKPSVLVGSGPILAIARSIAATARVIDMPPEHVAETDFAHLIGRLPEGTTVFAALGLHALNHARSDLLARLANAGYAFSSLVHPSAAVDATAKIGPNVLVGALCSVGPECVIGTGAVVLDGARLETGATLGEYAWLGANVVLGFGASVGAHSILRPGVHLDAGVPVGRHCELALSGLRQAAISDATFETAAFRTARVYAGAIETPCNR